MSTRTDEPPHGTTECRCTFCSQFPINGRRYKPLKNQEIDLCEDCRVLADEHYAPLVLGIDRGAMRFIEADEPLSVAVAAGAFRIVEWLVCQFGADPFKRTIYGCSAAELCQRVQLKSEMRQKPLLFMTQYARRRDFLCATETLSTSTAVRYDDVAALVLNLTSVYDLRTLFTIATTNLPPPPTKRVLLQAFERDMTEKLVLDNDASHFFELAINACGKRGLLSYEERCRWKRENVRVNMENAAWVKEIKQNTRNLREQVQCVEQRVESVKRTVADLRNALIAMKEESETHREKNKRVVSLLSMGLCLVVAPVFEPFFSTVIDMAVPVTLLLATVKLEEDHVTEFLVSKTALFVLNAGVERVLEKAHIDSVELSTCYATPLSSTSST